MASDPTDEIKVRRRKLEEYVQDPNNANKGSERGRRITKTSLEQRGTGRSLLAASDDVFLAGNQTAKMAQEAGITDVIEIETDGKTLIVVKRIDLQSGDEAARLIGIEDNRSRDHSEWDAEQILADIDAGLDLDHLFRLDELDDLQADFDIDSAVDAVVDAAASGEGEGGERIKGRNPAKMIKPVLYADQLEVFERAIRATGIVNRGDALVAVCAYYLENRPPQTLPDVLPLGSMAMGTGEGK